jgi:Helix-turn-helix.
MNISEFLTRKFIEWQHKTGQRKTVEDFASYIGVERSLLSKWLNGRQTPGPESKRLIIERYGIEAIEAFDEDPDLYAVKEIWDYLSPETRRKLREQAESLASKNETKKQREQRQRFRATG